MKIQGARRTRHRISRGARLVLAIIAVVTVLGVGLMAGRQLAKMGSTDSPGTPQATPSYTLEHIYNRLDTGAMGTPHTFAEPTAAPSSGTMYTLDEIMSLAPSRDDVDGALSSDVAGGKKFWGLTGGEWGPRTGSATVRGNVSGPNGALSFTIPDGFYSGGKTATARESELSDPYAPDYIRADSSIFGVDGRHPHVQVAATGQTNVIVTGDDGSNQVGAIIYFQPEDDRFTVSGDTVTDNLTGLMWAKDASLGGAMSPYDACEYGYELDYGGYDDWRLANVSELFSLLDFYGASARSPMLPDGHPFVNVQSGKYWSSTGDPYASSVNGYAVDLSNGEVEHVLPQAATVYPGWYVRGMKDW